MWRTGRTPPWAPALTGALLLLLAAPLWSQQDGGMDFDQVTGGAPRPISPYENAGMALASRRADTPIEAAEPFLEQPLKLGQSLIIE